MEPAKELSSGEVGYITASIKTVSDARVGDTVTTAENPASEALAGYRKVNPMVFCGVYPADGADYPALKDALENIGGAMARNLHRFLARIGMRGTENGNQYLVNNFSPVGENFSEG